MDIAGRVPRLRACFADAGADALLVTRPANIRYLTGFTGSAGRLLVLPDELVFVTDGRYGEQAADQLGSAGVEARIEVTTAEQEAVLQRAAAGVAHLGLEAADVTWAAQRRYASHVFADAELVATTGLVEALRLVKDDGEIARIQAAAAIADAALAEVRPLLAPGI